MDDIYPVTIIYDRYGGVYSGGRWVAFNLYYDDIPGAVSGDDISCHEFWSEFKNRHGVAGRGDTPDEALEDLRSRRRLK